MISKIKKIQMHLKQDGIWMTMLWLRDCVKIRLAARHSQKMDDTGFVDFSTIITDPKCLTKKAKPIVFIVAAVPYYDIGGGQRCSQLAKTFNAMGYNVFYLYGFDSSESQQFFLPMPMEGHFKIDKDTVSKIEDKVCRNDLFIFESPAKPNGDILELAVKKNARICYENIDNWETSLGCLVYDEETLIKLLTHADLLVGTAKPLVKQLEDYLEKYQIEAKPVHYLANAVDEQLFCGLKEFEKPEDMVTGEQTLLYYGSLWGKWFDWELLIELAKAHPEYAFNIIGDAGGISQICQSCPENIHFLGLKKQMDLPAYLKYTDYAMIPFKPGEISDYVSPLKVFEYISMYTKVLCTELPDVKGYPNVYCGNTAQSWQDIIASAPKLDKAAADDFILDNTWFSRASDMIDVIYPEAQVSAFKDKVSVVVLNYNNKNFIFKCIDTLLKYNKYYNYEIIIVDNGSTDGSYELLQQTYSNGQIILTRNDKNGCSSGRNLGVSKSTREFILFLDSDQWISNPYWLQPYEQIVQAHPDFGAIGWGAGFFNKQNRAYHVVDSFAYRYMPSTMLCRYDIGYLATCGMLVRKSDFYAVDGFDLHYDPTCYEDTDFAIKLRSIGKKLYYCPYLGVIHLPHQTTKSGSQAHFELLSEKFAYFHSKWKDRADEVLLYKI